MLQLLRVRLVVQRDRPLKHGGRLPSLPRLAAASIVAAASVPLVYLGAAVIGALLPRNPSWEAAEHGVLIFVRTNGIHSDLVLPASAASVDWYASLPPRHVPDPAAADGWIGIGWGQREFYLQTRTWADLDARAALRAVFGGDAVIHVDHGDQPAPSETHRPLHLEPDGYLRMAAAIAQTFERNSTADPIPLLGRGYGADDVFYEARGTYHALRTSNQWTADMLAAGGVEIGLWTPFEASLMWRFR